MSTTGWPAGFWAAELIHPFHAFREAGYDVTIASPDGGSVEIEAFSDPKHESGYSKDDELSGRYLNRPEFMKLLENTPAVATQSVDDFEAIMVSGGHGPMFTFPDATDLHALFSAFDRAGKVTATLCHGTSLLFYIRKEDGRPFVEGRRITGFTNAEEDVVEETVGQQVAPFRIEDEATRLGAIFVKGPPYQPHAIRDDQLITGQQQQSGGLAAELVLKALA